jgi:non-ribosomal peptide synthetase component F
MGEPADDARYLALLRDLDWGQLMADLVLFGTKKKRLSPAYAEEMASEAIARVCDPRRSPWDPSRGAKMLTHLAWVLESVLEHDRAKRKRRKTDLAGDDAPEPPPDSDGDPDVRAGRDETLAELRDKLFAAVAKRPLALQLLALEEAEQISDIDTQVSRTGATRAQVYEARRVLADAARTILAEGGHHLSRERSALQRGRLVEPTAKREPDSKESE